jgi:hypothetical protein
MSDSPPDRLSNDPRSPFYNENALKRDIGVRFKGIEKSNVEEYCVSENWVRVSVGKSKDRYGNPLTLKLTGTVEPYFKNIKSEPELKPAPEAKPAPEVKPAKEAKPEPAAKAEQQARPEKAQKPAKAEKPSAKPKKKPEKSAKPAKPAKKKK